MSFSEKSLYFYRNRNEIEFPNGQMIAFRASYFLTRGMFIELKREARCKRIKENLDFLKIRKIKQKRRYKLCQRV